MFSIEPENGVDKPQMAILLKHLTPAPTTSPPPQKICMPFKTLTLEFLHSQS